MFANTPKTYLLNSEGQVNVQAVSPLRLLFALAWFNSLPVDWLARQMIQINVNKPYLYRLPMPQPTDAEILANLGYAQLAKNALLLSLAASWDDFAELAPLFNVQPKTYPKPLRRKTRYVRKTTNWCPNFMALPIKSSNIYWAALRSRPASVPST